MGPAEMSNLRIREFSEEDAQSIRELFILTNRALAPPQLKDRFEAYIKSSLDEEIDKISEYYSEKGGSFWVSTLENRIVGMFGLEANGEGSMELRRMYVDHKWRKQGIAQKMLKFAEDICIKNGRPHLELSTSELQKAALSFYRHAGYQLLRENTADTANNKTIGGGIRRYYFQKILGT